MRFGNIAVRLLQAEALQQRALDLIEGVDPKGKVWIWKKVSLVVGPPARISSNGLGKGGRSAL